VPAAAAPKTNDAFNMINDFRKRHQEQIDRIARPPNAARSSSTNGGFKIGDVALCTPDDKEIYDPFRIKDIVKARGKTYLMDEHSRIYWIEQCRKIEDSSQKGRFAAPAASPSPDYHSAKSSPVSLEDGFIFNYINNNKLIITNSHHNSFELNKGTSFISEVTFEEKDFGFSDFAKTANFNMKTGNGLKTGIIEGTFEHFHEDTAEVSLDSYSKFWKVRQRKQTINYISSLQFWQNLKIITKRNYFPKNGEFYTNSDDQIVFTPSNSKKYVLINDGVKRFHKFSEGDQFETTVFRDKNWKGWITQGYHIDFAEIEGKEVKISGTFKSFEQDGVKITIDYNISNKLLTGLALLSTATTQGIETHGLNATRNAFQHMGLQPLNALIGGGSGGAVLTYKVEYDAAFPFWKNLMIVKSYCNIANKTKKYKIKAVNKSHLATAVPIVRAKTRKNRSI